MIGRAEFVRKQAIAVEAAGIGRTRVAVVAGPVAPTAHPFNAPDTDGTGVELELVQTVLVGVCTGAVYAHVFRTRVEVIFALFAGVGGVEASAGPAKVVRTGVAVVADYPRPATNLVAARVILRAWIRVVAPAAARRVGARPACAAIIGTVVTIDALRVVNAWYPKRSRHGQRRFYEGHWLVGVGLCAKGAGISLAIGQTVVIDGAGIFPCRRGEPPAGGDEHRTKA